MEDPIPPELMTMPEDVMKIILEKCDFISIQRLRHTCHTIRNFINLTKPKYRIKYIEVAGSRRDMKLFFSEGGAYDLWPPKIVMLYAKHDEETTAVYWLRGGGHHTKILENSNFLKLFSRDLESILDRNSTILNTLVINCDENVPGRIQKFLETCGNTPIKTHALSIINATRYEDVTAVLPYTCPDTLKTLEIDGDIGRWDISKIVELDHWKKAEKLQMSGMSVRAGIQHFMHFESADFRMDEGTTDDVIRVKENFLKSPSTTKYLHLMFDCFDDKDRLMEIFGEPFQDIKWFFRRSDNNVLSIELHGTHLTCYIKTLANVPVGARVIG
ncbi:unnamed protein product [Caenorhabditis brenneri]